MKSKRSLSGAKKYYLSDLGFYFSMNTDNRINFGPVLENIVYLYARSLDYHVSIGRIGKLEVDFILRDNEMNYSYIQVAYTIALSKETEDREYKPLEQIKDNYNKYVVTTDRLLQKRNGIHHVNLQDFMLDQKQF
jgi:predicted AAA+ superfamily ATPase